MPFLTAIASLTVTIGASMFMHGYIGGIETFYFGIFSVIACMFL
jgi:hypothetical protein